MMDGDSFGGRPLLRPWYRVAWEEERVLLQYAGSIVSLEGRAARRLLPALLPLLDGTRTVDEIVASLGEPARPAVENVLEVLDGHHLLTAPVDDRYDSGLETASFLAAVDASSSLDDVAARLEDGVVALVGTEPMVVDLAQLLRRSGVGGIERLVWEDGLDGVDLVLVVPGGEELPRLSRWNERALADGVPWLQLLPFDGLLSVVGPLYVPGETACYECYRARRASTFVSPERALVLDGTAAPSRSAPFVDALAVAIASTLALRWLGSRDGRVPGMMVAVEPRGEVRLTNHVVHRVPRCAACSELASSSPPLPWLQGAVDDHR